MFNSGFVARQRGNLCCQQLLPWTPPWDLGLVLNDMIGMAYFRVICRGVVSIGVANIFVDFVLRYSIIKYQMCITANYLNGSCCPILYLSCFSWLVVSKMFIFNRLSTLYGMMILTFTELSDWWLPARSNQHWYPLVNIQKAIEHGPVEIVDFPIKKWWFSMQNVSSPEGRMIFPAQNGAGTQDVCPKTWLTWRRSWAGVK